jgi:hypothetical protein
VVLRSTIRARPGDRILQAETGDWESLRWTFTAILGDKDPADVESRIEKTFTDHCPRPD